MTDTITQDEALARARDWAASKKMVKADTFDDIVEVTTTRYVRTRSHAVTDIARIEPGEGRAKAPQRAVQVTTPTAVLGVPTDKKTLKSHKGTRYKVQGSDVNTPCRDCSGKGKKRHDACNGRGEVRCPPNTKCSSCDGRGRTIEVSGSVHCNSCNGRGSRICGTCNGTGHKKCKCNQGQVSCSKCEAKGSILTYKVIQGERTVTRASETFEPSDPPTLVLAAFSFEDSEYDPGRATEVTPVETTWSVRQTTVLDVAEIRYRSGGQVHSAYVLGTNRQVVAKDATTLRRRVLTVVWLIVLAAIVAGIVMLVR